MAKKDPGQTGATEVKMVKVKLSKNHTHAGTDYTAGDEIEVKESLIPWLQKNGLIAAKKEG